jgi:hypothetical protein
MSITDIIKTLNLIFTVICGIKGLLSTDTNSKQDWYFFSIINIIAAAA